MISNHWLNEVLRLVLRVLQTKYMKACALKYGKVYDYIIPSFSMINYLRRSSHRLSHLATQFA